MKTRPWPLTLIALSFVFIAASIPLQASILFEIPLYRLDLLWGNLTVLNLIIMALLIFQIPMVLDGHRWIKFTLPVTAGLVLFNNYLVGDFGFQYGMMSTTVASLCFMLIVGSALHPRVLFVLQNPQKRWWRAHPRKTMELPLRMYNNTLPTQIGYTVDVSKNGAFITFEDPEVIQNFEPGSSIDIDLTLKDLVHVKLNAKIVRVAVERRGNYPVGLGVQFSTDNTRHRRLLNELVL